MAIFRLRGLGTKGIISDIPPFDLPPDTWSDGRNVRFQAGRVQKIGGCVQALTTGMPDELPLAVVQRPISESLIYGTEQYLWRAEGVTHMNISARKTDVPEDPVQYEASQSSSWDYTTLSNTVVFNTKLNDPQGLAPRDEYFSTIPGWGQPNETGSTLKNWKTNRIRAYKNYLLCMGMIENGVEYPQRVRWSDVAYINSLPANWWEDSDTHDGGFNDLSDSMSHIIDGRPLRDSFVIYTNRDTFVMDYVGGTMIFNFRKIFSDSGILAPNCCIEFEGKHFVISEEDIFVHNGSTRQAVATGRIKDILMKEISSTNYLATKVYSYPTRKEIWIAYVGPGNTGTDQEKTYACNKAAVWSWEYDTWSFTDLPNVFDIGMGIPPDTDSRSWENRIGNPEIGPVPGDDIWEGKDEEAREEVWEQFAQTFTRHIMFAPSVDKCFYNLDQGYFFYKWDSVTKTATRRPVVCELVRQALDFDEQETDISYHKWWRAIYPQMTGIGTVRFFVGGSNNPYQSPDWDSSQEFVIGEDYKVDCFSNYRYPAVRIQDAAEGDWSMTGMDIEYFREGNR